MSIRDSLNSAIKLGMAVREECMGTTFDWENNSYTCTVGGGLQEQPSIVAGFGNILSYKFNVPTEQFNGVQPEINDFIYYAGYKLLIKNIIRPSHGLYFVMECDLPEIK